MVLNKVVSELIICVGGFAIFDNISDLSFFRIFWLFSGFFFLLINKLILRGINFLSVGSLVLRKSVSLSVILNSVRTGITINVCSFLIVC